MDQDQDQGIDETKALRLQLATLEQEVADLEAALEACQEQRDSARAEQGRLRDVAREAIRALDEARRGQDVDGARKTRQRPAQTPTAAPMSAVVARKHAREGQESQECACETDTTEGGRYPPSHDTPCVPDCQAYSVLPAPESITENLELKTRPAQDAEQS